MGDYHCILEQGFVLYASWIRTFIISGNMAWAEEGSRMSKICEAVGGVYTELLIQLTDRLGTGTGQTVLHRAQKRKIRQSCLVWLSIY